MELTEYQRKKIESVLEKMSNEEREAILNYLSISQNADDPYIFLNQIKGFLGCLRINGKIEPIENATFRQWAQYRLGELIEIILSKIETVEKK